DRHGRGRREREIASGATGDGEQSWITVRLLHAGLRDVALRRLLPQRFEDARAVGRATRGKFVPLHWVLPDQRRRRRSVWVPDRQRSIQSAVEKRTYQSRFGSLRIKRRKISASGIHGRIVLVHGR